MIVEHSLNRYAQLIETELDRLFPAAQDAHSRVIEAARYSLLSEGKRLRPALLLEFFTLFCSDLAAAMPFACAIEMIHTYSLIHDDLPCMDDDDVRRGKPSCHRAFDEATALLAGDALLNRAYEIMAESTGVPAERALRAMAYIAGQCGAFGMIGGQSIDLSLEGGSGISPETHSRMASLKTATLFRAACAGGCILAGADAGQTEAAASFAEAFGMAFQATDDMLDISGIEAVLGKPVGSDQRSGKSTFVSVHGVEDTQMLVLDYLQSAAQCLEELPESELLSGLCTWVGSRVR